MGRIRQFDSQELEQKAMEFFWLKGYQAVSVDDLVLHLGISRSSIYSVWAGKQELFAKVFQRYISTIGMEALRPLLTEPGQHIEAHSLEVVKTSIEKVFFTIAKQISQDPLKRGCLMVNSIIELSGLESELLKMALNAKNEVWKLFRSRLEVFVAKAIWTAEDADSKSDFLLTVFMGLRVLARSGPSAQQANGVVRTSIDAVFA